MSSALEMREIVPTRGTTLSRVVDWLHEHDNRVYWGDMVVDSHPESGWAERVSIFVAPTIPIYDPEKLNGFMDGLIPDEPRSSRDGFWPLNQERLKEVDELRIGKLYFDEHIGFTVQTGETTTTAIDEAAMRRVGIKTGTVEVNTNEPIERRTWVFVFPHPLLAEIVGEYEQLANKGQVEHDYTFSTLKHSVKVRDLERLKKNENPFRRVAGFLRG